MSALRAKLPTVALTVALTAASAGGAREARAESPAPHVGTETAVPVLVVTQTDAIVRGARVGPGVSVAQAPLSATTLAREEATSLVRPATLSAFAGYRANAPVQGPEISVSVTQDLALRGLGGARREVADQMKSSVMADVERARLESALRALLAWEATVEAKEVLRIRTAALAEAEAIAKGTRARVGSGVGQPRELALAEGDVGSAQAAVLDAEGALVEAHVELRFALGISPDDAIDVAGDLYASDETPVARDGAIRATADHPALRAARARTELAKREVDLARAHFGPVASVGGSYAREASGEQIVGALVGVPIPIADPSRYEQARLMTTENAARAQASRVELELQRDVRLALHDREHWREVREALRTRALGPLREALRLVRKEYDVGTQDVTMVLLAHQRLLAAEEQMARAAGAVLRADAHVAALTGALAKRSQGGSP